MANANYNSAVLDGVRKFTTAVLDMAGNFKAMISDLIGGIPRLDSIQNHPVLADRVGKTPILADKAEYNAVLAQGTGKGAILADKAEYNAVLTKGTGKAPVLADSRSITKRISMDRYKAVALIAVASAVNYFPVLMDKIANTSFRLIDSSAWKLLF